PSPSFLFDQIQTNPIFLLLPPSSPTLNHRFSIISGIEIRLFVSTTRSLEIMEIQQTQWLPDLGMEDPSFNYYPGFDCYSLDGFDFDHDTIPLAIPQSYQISVHDQTRPAKLPKHQLTITNQCSKASSPYSCVISFESSTDSLQNPTRSAAAAVKPEYTSSPIPEHGTKRSAAAAMTRIGGGHEEANFDSGDYGEWMVQGWGRRRKKKEDRVCLGLIEKERR
ncbi:unnamed protein product, partial [Linum tenue]